jgi:hypothetical protein
VSAPPITVSGASQACIEVLVVRDVGRASAHPAQACAGG